jgi:hypothetical protein
MSESPDPLEAELSALRPLEVSPELRRRIAERLADSPPAKYRPAWRFALVGGLAAACLAAVLVRWGGGGGVKPTPIVVAVPPAQVVDVERSGTTLLAYQRALARSPEELDALLDRDAANAPDRSPELMRICAFTRSDAALHALLGED